MRCTLTDLENVCHCCVFVESILVIHMYCMRRLGRPSSLVPAAFAHGTSLHPMLTSTDA